MSRHVKDSKAYPWVQLPAGPTPIHQTPVKSDHDPRFMGERVHDSW